MSNLNLRYFLENGLPLTGVVFQGQVNLNAEQDRHYLVANTGGNKPPFEVYPCEQSGNGSSRPVFRKKDAIGISKANHWEDPVVQIAEVTKQRLVATGRFSESELENL